MTVFLLECIMAFMKIDKYYKYISMVTQLIFI